MSPVAVSAASSDAEIVRALITWVKMSALLPKCADHAGTPAQLRHLGEAEFASAAIRGQLAGDPEHAPCAFEVGLVDVRAGLFRWWHDSDQVKTGSRRRITTSSLGKALASFAAVRQSRASSRLRRK